MPITNTLVQHVNITVTVREDLTHINDHTDIEISASLLRMFADSIMQRGMAGLKRDYSNLSVECRIGDVYSKFEPGLVKTPAQHSK
jgi:hypothetical protein